ncbi:MAG: 16S rRNA (cytidine(1402)-2'-O)-methyltransferase [Rhodobacteraceae bacterium]|nr:16S rRNA (cytidine(1402)-2'-O)-methyltransferase [Paracoccaceae bacterium]
MEYRTRPLTPRLYLVATPIGSARDITLRTLDILSRIDVLVCEDTRTLRHLLNIHGIALKGRPLLTYHDHCGAKERQRVLSFLAAGKSVVYASEAGSPLIADPGFALVRDAVQAGYEVSTAPGPSAIIAALTVSGLPTDAFFFGGFLPATAAARCKALEALASVAGTLVFCESPKRVAAMLRDAAQVLGPDRQAALCRELTKAYEQVLRDRLSALAERAAAQPLKGEIVVLIDRPSKNTCADEDLESALRTALVEMSLRDAAEVVAKSFGAPKQRVYKMALRLYKNT